MLTYGIRTVYNSKGWNYTSWLTSVQFCMRKDIYTRILNVDPYSSEEFLLHVPVIAKLHNSLTRKKKIPGKFQKLQTHSKTTCLVWYTRRCRVRFIFILTKKEKEGIVSNYRIPLCNQMLKCRLEMTSFSTKPSFLTPDQNYVLHFMMSFKYFWIKGNGQRKCPAKFPDVTFQDLFCWEL